MSMRLHQHDKIGRRRESGQTLILFVLFMIVLFLFIGLGIDLGFAYITKAQLSKGVDAAALAGMLNFSQGTLTAQNVASDTFAANYRRTGRDVGPVTPSITFSTDATTGNRYINVSATTAINTFFIRALPEWHTLQVSANAQATRSKLVLSLVLDRSGSMGSNGGSTHLPPAVSHFIDFFDDASDRVSMSSFSCVASTDVTMRRPFNQDIKNAANALPFDGWTCSEGGLTNGLAQNNTVTNTTGENVTKVMVFFTDGMANTWYYPSFDCGVRNIAPDKTLYDPNSTNTSCALTAADTGCTKPNQIPSIDGINNVDTSICANMNREAEKRAQAVAKLARSQGIIIYSIGLGDSSVQGECDGAFPVLNPDFLKNVANTTDSPNYDPNSTEPVGDYAIAADATQLDHVFKTIASKILLRLTR